MKKMTMRTILTAGFAMASLLPTLPAHAATGNIAVQPNDPIATAFRRTLEDAGNSTTSGQPNDPIGMAYRRTLEDPSNVATTRQLSDPIAMATLEVAANCATTGQPNDPIGMAYWRTLEVGGDCATTGQPNDPIATAYRRTLEGFVDPTTTGQPNDPIAMAYRRTLEGFVDFANTAQPDDSLVWEKIGGVNVFGGAVGLYATGGMLVGSLGVSGNTSCTDYVIPRKLRKALGLGQAPAGVHPGPGGSAGDTNVYLVSDETSNSFHTPHALHQPPMRILILLSKGGL